MSLSKFGYLWAAKWEKRLFDSEHQWKFTQIKKQNRWRRSEIIVSDRFW